MNPQALAVIEAARGLELHPARGAIGLWTIGCEPRRTARVFQEIGEAIQAFDRASGQSKDPLSYLARAIKYAESRGIPAEEMIAELKGLNAGDDEARNLDGATDYKPKPGELGPPDRTPGGALVMAPGGESDQPDLATKYEETDTGVPEEYLKAPAPQILPSYIATMHQSPRMIAWKKEIDQDFDSALSDGGDYEHDIAQSIDAIEDRLEFAVNKIGWTPKLRGLMAALMKVRMRVGVEHTAGGSQFTMSAGDLNAVLKMSADLSEIERNPEVALREEYEAPRPSFGR